MRAVGRLGSGFAVPQMQPRRGAWVDRGSGRRFQLPVRENRRERLEEEDRADKWALLVSGREKGS